MGHIYTKGGGGQSAVGVSVAMFGTQSIPSGVETPVNWDTGLFDTGGFNVSTVFPNVNFFCPTGIYVLTTSIEFAASASTYQPRISFQKGGAAGFGATFYPTVPIGNLVILACSIVVRSGIPFSLYGVSILQNSGAALNIGGGTSSQTNFGITGWR